MYVCVFTGTLLPWKLKVEGMFSIEGRCVEIKEDQPNKKTIFIYLEFTKEKSKNCHLCLSETQRQAEEWKRLIVKKGISCMS